jgi:hypothetical protein
MYWRDEAVIMEVGSSPDLLFLRMRSSAFHRRSISSAKCGLKSGTGPTKAGHPHLSIDSVLPEAQSLHNTRVWFENDISAGASSKLRLIVWFQPS